MSKAMRRLPILAYGVLGYAVGVATLLYTIGFVADVGVPKAMDSAPQEPFGLALLADLGLVALFGLQHSVMARPGFKRAWTRWVPVAAERSTYLLFTSAALALLYWGWQPLGGTLWQVADPLARGALYGASAVGWCLMLASTFQISHFDLFGLRQAWLHFRGRDYTPAPFVMPSLYRRVRHPLYLGLLLAFWSTPTMTVTHVAFALAMTAYVLVAIRLEERDLLAAHPEYALYRRQVPMLLPRLSGRTDRPRAAR